ncbi:MAG: class I SAM-dependent methyltransferase [Caldilineaceae bacterium]
MNQGARVQQVCAVIKRLVDEGTVVADADGSTHSIFPVAASPTDGAALQRWVIQAGAAQTIEIGLGYGMSALNICAGLLTNGHADAHHVVIDPFQSRRFANCGLQLLQEAGVPALVEHHTEKSHFVLPRLLSAERQFDFAYVDGNHRFDSVFVDLYYLGLLVRQGGIIMLDDYDLPGIERAVAFFVTNLNWTVEEAASDWVVLRTAQTADDRHFTYFVEF